MSNQSALSLNGKSVWELVKKGFLFSCNLRRDVMTQEVENLLVRGDYDVAIIATEDDSDTVDYFFLLDSSDKVVDYMYNMNMPADEVSDYLVSLINNYIDAKKTKKS